MALRESTKSNENRSVLKTVAYMGISDWGRGYFVCGQALREAATICPASCKMTFDLLTLKVVSESRVTWATSVPILVFLGLSVLDIGLMYASDRQTSDRQTLDAHHRLMPLPRGRGIITPECGM